MNTIQRFAFPLVAVASILAAGSAFAEVPESQQDVVFEKTQTREQVTADLFKARADGSIKVSSNQYNPLVVAKSTRTREEVRAEAVAANRAGYDQLWYGEDSGSFALSRTPATRHAAPVYAGNVSRGE